MNYTSGTTGKPKGVKSALIPGDPDEVLSMFAMILSFFEIQPQENNVHIVGSPLYHTAVLVHSSAALHYGHSVVLMEKFDAEQMLYLIDKYKVTTSHMVPTQFHRLLQLPDEIRAKYDCSSTRAMIHAAAPCPIHTKQAMIEWWGNSIWEYYAATEGGGTVVDADSWSKFPGTVGKAWPGAEIKIINDNGTEAKPDDQGTVFMKLGEATKFEYKGDQAKTKKERLIFDDQVYFTVGDIGYLNDEGYLFLCDRKIDMIISGGANIYPAEIVGGVDKGNDYMPLMSMVREKVKAIICLGTDNNTLKSVFSKATDILVETTSMDEAVKIAYKIAEKGETVLLSPACASFDLFKNYEDRGDQFKAAVKNL